MFASAVYLLLAATLVTSLPVTSLPAVVAGFSNDTIQKVQANLLQIATHSWELGTAAQALTELLTPSLSVFEATAFPPPATLNFTKVGNASSVLDIAWNTVNTKPRASMTLIDGDGAVGDPASLGVAVLIANWTRSDMQDARLAEDSRSQLAYLTDVAPRTQDGAISHRADQVQLWADFVYMAPPFLAYFGALQGGKTATWLLQLAYDQCRLYRNYLRDEPGLWKHIVLGDSSSQDASHWGTGNAWAAAGMMRVLQTIRHSPLAKGFQHQPAPAGRSDGLDAPAIEWDTAPRHWRPNNLIAPCAANRLSRHARALRMQLTSRSRLQTRRTNIQANGILTAREPERHRQDERPGSL